MRSLLALAVVGVIVAGGLGFLGIGPGASYVHAYQLQGRWESDIVGSSAMTFFRDGRVQEEALLTTNDGTFELNDGRIYFEFEGLIWGKNRSNWAYEFDGWDRLKLSDCNVLPGLQVVLTRTE